MRQARHVATMGDSARLQQDAHAIVQNLRANMIGCACVRHVRQADTMDDRARAKALKEREEEVKGKGFRVF